MRPGRDAVLSCRPGPESVGLRVEFTMLALLPPVPRSLLQLLDEPIQSRVKPSELICNEQADLSQMVLLAHALQGRQPVFWFRRHSYRPRQSVLL